LLEKESGRERDDDARNLHLKTTATNLFFVVIDEIIFIISHGEQRGKEVFKRDRERV
jgi:hypothetical protein